MEKKMETLFDLLVGAIFQLLKIAKVGKYNFKYYFITNF